MMTAMPQADIGNAMTTGRPTKYDPAFCDEVIDFLSEGYSVTAWAGSKRVARSSVYKWANEHPEFSDALNIGQAASALWWETCLRTNATTGDGASSAIIFGLKNRAADDWRDKRDIDHSSTDGSMSPPTTVVLRGIKPNDPSGD
jgi:hypothetical protein